MPDKIPIKEALKLWIGDKYDDNDYRIYKRMKKIGCIDIFFEGPERGGGLYFGKEYVD